MEAQKQNGDAAADSFGPLPPGVSVVGVEHDQSPALGRLALALAKAQGEFEVASKDSKNPHLGSNYADLASVFAACRKPLSKYELAVLQPITTTDTGVIIETLLVHSSNEFIRCRMELKIEVRVSKEGKSQPWSWAFGSAVSYGRRYALSSLVGIAAGDDDDGAASTAEAPDRRQQKSRTQQVKDDIKQQQQGAPTAPSFLQQIQQLAAAAKLEGDLGAFIKVKTGKGKPSELTAADVQKIRAELATPPAAA